MKKFLAMVLGAIIVIGLVCGINNHLSDKEMNEWSDEEIMLACILVDEYGNGIEDIEIEEIYSYESYVSGEQDDVICYSFTDEQGNEIYGEMFREGLEYYYSQI